MSSFTKTKYRYPFVMLILLAVLFCGFVSSFWIGRYPASFMEVLSCIRATIFHSLDAIDKTLYTIVMEIRLPRILIAILVGGALASSGASYQTLFKNPMVSPDLLGVSAGASVGAAIAMLNNESWLKVQLFAFAFGVVAVFLTNFISKIIGGDSITILILSGVVVGGLFQAILSIIKTLADTEDTLPNITFWLMGSLGKSSLGDVKYLLPSVALGMIALFVTRHNVNALSAGEDEAMSMGVNVRLTKAIVIISSTVMTVCSVSICGIIGWIGLIIPHIARILVGADYGKILLSSFLCGGIFLLCVDNFVRGANGSELPLSVVTALVGTPVFVLLLYKSRRMNS